MQIKIHELADKEFQEAIEWYELQSKGLGSRFKRLVLEQVSKIKKHPEWFLIEEGNVYKAYIPKFPYKILYTIEGILLLFGLFHICIESHGTGSRE